MKLTYLKDVVTLRHCPDTCKNCGICLEVCPRAVFRREKAVVLVKDRDACIECGACQRNCPFGAVQVRAGVGCAQAVLQGTL
jgi:NAD-dependent dihydropyrimidine dehydrogenase PreA subunit